MYKRFYVFIFFW